MLLLKSFCHRDVPYNDLFLLYILFMKSRLVVDYQEHVEHDASL